MVSLRFVRLGILLVAMMLPVPSTADNCSTVLDGSQIDGKYVDDLIVALKDFRKTRQSLACFKIEVGMEGAETHIALIPKHTEQEGIVLGGRTECGYGVSYLLKSGKIEKKWFAR